MVAAGKPISYDIASGDGIVLNYGGGRILGFVVASTTAAAGDVIFYDNASAASGVVLCRISVPSTAVGIATDYVSIYGGVHFMNGVYVDITDLTTGSIIIYVE